MRFCYFKNSKQARNSVNAICKNLRCTEAIKTVSNISFIEFVIKRIASNMKVHKKGEKTSKLRNFYLTGQKGLHFIGNNSTHVLTLITKSSDYWNGLTISNCKLELH